MTDLARELYQQIIIDHGRKPRNFRVMEPGDSHAKIILKRVGHNPLCGDKLILFIELDPTRQKILDVSFQGEGCAISMASSSLMTEAVKELTISEALSLFAGVHDLVMGKLAHVSQEGLEDQLGKLSVLSGVSAYPARVKCASLGWQVLKAILEDLEDKDLDKTQQEVSTE